MEIIFATEAIDEAFHIMVDIKNEVVQRWAVFNNETKEILGEPGEGTSIDFDEPFVIGPQVSFTLNNHIQFFKIVKSLFISTVL